MRHDQVLKLRDDLAKATLARIREDRDGVPEHLKGHFDVIARRLFDSKFDVNALWSESGVTRVASASLSSHLGETPWAYISERRIEVGARLLLVQDVKIHQIGEALGYVGNNFCKAFQRRRELSPSEYRDRALAEAERPAAGSPLPMPALPTGSEATANALAARRDIGYVDAALRARIFRGLAGISGLASHEEGSANALVGDVDRAYEQMELARRSYAQAGELPSEVRRKRRSLVVPYDTGDALRSAFCGSCRKTLDDPEGYPVRRALRAALSPVSRDLEWFESCCDDCYRVVWAALCRARLGLLDDASKAWWLSENVDLEDPEAPPSRGRIIAALSEVERRTFGDQRERRKYCDLAVADAVVLEDPLLEAEARIWRASVLRAMAEFPEARAELARTVDVVRLSPWLAALHTRMAGILADNTNDYPKALESLQAATKLYEELDLHIAGLFVIEQANAHFSQGEYERSIELDLSSRAFLDDRRDSLPGNAAVPMHVAASYGCLKQWDKAELVLSECRFDRELEPGAAASEVFTRACLQLGRGKSREALSLFAEAKERFEKLHLSRSAALSASYSVEAYVHLGDRTKALQSACAALRFFKAAGCPQDTLDALGKLRALLEAEVIDATAVTTSVRSLALKHGGWLPAPDIA